MKYLIAFTFFSSVMVSTLQAYAESIKSLKVVSVYQIEDDSDAGFDFFTSKKVHKCGGKLSNRFRSYSDDPQVSERKLSLILNAMNHGYSLTVGVDDCEGKAMRVDYIGISRGS